MTSVVIQLSKNVFGGSDWFKKRNIYESMTPFYYMARFYGYAPFQLGTNDPKIKAFDVLLVAFNFLCYVYAIYVQITIKTIHQNIPLCINIAINVLYFVTTCVSLLTLIRILFNRRKIRAIFDQLNAIDVEVIFFKQMLLIIRSHSLIFSSNLMEY